MPRPLFKPVFQAVPVPTRNFLCIGIDPGASGGMAAIFPDGKLETCTNSFTMHDRWEMIKDWTERVLLPRTEAFAVIEKVGGFVKGNPAPGSAMFNFGASFGELRAFLVAASIPFQEDTPQTWMKTFGMRREKDESGTAWKNRLKAHAQKLFPIVKITNATADAVLIAEYCRRTRT